MSVNLSQRHCNTKNIPENKSLIWTSHFSPFLWLHLSDNLWNKVHLTYISSWRLSVCWN